MPRGSVDMNLLFTLGEVQRLVARLCRQAGGALRITRAQWAVLAKVERTEGLKQTELAEQMEMQPITLTRLIDRLCDNGLDRAPQRRVRPPRQPAVFAQGGAAAARQIERLRSETDDDGAGGQSARSDAHRLLAQLETIKENVRNAIQDANEATEKKEQAMADPVLKFPPDQKGNPRAPRRRQPRSRAGACWRACGNIADSCCWWCCRWRLRSAG